jgi:hypothetical protein
MLKLGNTFHSNALPTNSVLIKRAKISNKVMKPKEKWFSIYMFYFDLLTIISMLSACHTTNAIALKNGK